MKWRTEIFQKRRLLLFPLSTLLFVSTLLISNLALAGEPVTGCCDYGIKGCANVHNGVEAMFCQGMCEGIYKEGMVCVCKKCVKAPEGGWIDPQLNQSSRYRTPLPIPSDSAVTFVLDESVPHSITITLPDELGGGDMVITDFQCTLTVKLTATEFPDILFCELLDLTASAPSFLVDSQETGQNLMTIAPCCHIGYYDLVTDSAIMSYNGVITNDLFAPDTIFVIGYAAGIFDDSGPEGILYLETHSIAIYPFSPFFQSIPTLTEWGLIIFCVVLFGWIAWVAVRRRRRFAAGS